MIVNVVSGAHPTTASPNASELWIPGPPENLTMLGKTEVPCWSTEHVVKNGSKIAHEVRVLPGLAMNTSVCHVCPLTFTKSHGLLSMPSIKHGPWLGLVPVLEMKLNVRPPM